jgi:hypothetical protein
MSKVQNMKIGPRTMVTLNGQPVLCGLVMRTATSAPSRVKAALVVPTEGKNGEKGVAPMPFAGATMGGKGWTPEFRLELN